MEDLEIRDDDGDAFTLSEAEYGAALTMESDMVTIGAVGARAVVDWLTERFELEAVSNLLRITVPGAAGGPAREVSWSGNAVPEWLERLAAVAISGMTPEHLRQGLALMRSFGGDRRSESDEAAFRAIQDAVRHARFDQSGSLVDQVQRMAQYARDAAADMTTPNHDVKVLHALMGALGCERATQLPERVEALRQECDRITRELLSWAGEAPGPDGVDQVALIGRIKTSYRKDRDELHRRMQELRRSHIVELQQVADRIGAQEREARAAINVELERVRAEVADRQQVVEALRTELADVREQLRLANVDRIGLRMDLHDRHKLERAREALRSVQLSSAPGSADVLNVVRGALEDTAPDA